MIKAPINLQDLRRRMYRKAKSEKEHRFWGIFGHMTKIEILAEAYRQAKRNGGAPGIDGRTFEDVETAGVERFLFSIREDLTEETYKPQANRFVEIPKGNGKTRTLQIPCIRDRVVQGALKWVLEAIFEADFCPNSYGFRPKRSPYRALAEVRRSILRRMNIVIDVDLSNYFDTIRYDILLGKIARRVQDPQVLHLVKQILKAGGKIGVPQGRAVQSSGRQYLLERGGLVLRRHTRQDGGGGIRIRALSSLSRRYCHHRERPSLQTGLGRKSPATSP